MLRFAVVRFPGSNCDTDCARAVGLLGHEAVYVWHTRTDLAEFDAVILPGGFSFGDYLRAGALARFSPVMEAVQRFVAGGGLVLGICNGFQILCEAGLLPGTLLLNAGLRFRCEPVHVRVENTATPFTRGLAPGQILTLPIAHGEGRYYADPATLARLEGRGQVVFRYSDATGRLTPEANPNGSAGHIAGIVNEAGNVLGMMPHPERRMEALLGGEDGRGIFAAMVETLMARASRRASAGVWA